MTMMGFHVLFPEEAERECRTVRPIHDESLPEHLFIFTEAYCFAPNCDCRRVLVNVLDAETHEHVATLSYGFDPPEPPCDEDEQLFLDTLNPQSSFSEYFLKIFEEMVTNDTAYRDRLVRHYEMWKSVIDDPTHPAHEKIRPAQASLEDAERTEPVRRSGPKVGANASCPCGSGRKYKNCCRP